MAVDIDRLAPVKERVQEGDKMSTESPQSGQVVWVAVHLELVGKCYCTRELYYLICLAEQGQAVNVNSFAFKFLSCPLFFVFLFLIIFIILIFF